MGTTINCTLGKLVTRNGRTLRRSFIWTVSGRCLLLSPLLPENLLLVECLRGRKKDKISSREELPSWDVIFQTPLLDGYGTFVTCAQSHTSENQKSEI